MRPQSGTGFAVLVIVPRKAGSCLTCSQIEVVDGNITVRIGTRHQTHRTIIHQMNPGLGMLLKNGDRILMQMPDAVNFCTRLRQQCNLPTITTSELLLERMLWQAIMNGYMGTTSSARRGTGPPHLPGKGLEPPHLSGKGLEPSHLPGKGMEPPHLPGKGLMDLKIDKLSSVGWVDVPLSLHIITISYRSLEFSSPRTQCYQ